MSHTLLQGWGKTVRLLLNTRGKREWIVPFGTNVIIVAKSCKSEGFSDRFKEGKLSSVKQGFYFLILRLILLSHSEDVLNSISNSVKNTWWLKSSYSVPWPSTMGSASCPSDNNLDQMGEVPVIQGQIDSKLRSRCPASLLPRKAGTLKGVLHTAVTGPVLTKADLQLSHYTAGREGRGVTEVTSSTGFKYCNSKIHFFVFHRRGAQHMKKATACWWPAF